MLNAPDAVLSDLVPFGIRCVELISIAPVKLFLFFASLCKMLQCLNLWALIAK